MSQIYNPYLPTFEYIPDGEPHVFGDRIYIYGSHDRCGSVDFCLNDYVCYSASIEDISSWRYEGVIYRKTQDPTNQNIPKDAPEQRIRFGMVVEREEDVNPRGIHAMWAPDVVCGPDGKYYLYYCLDFLPEIRVAVSDSPAGPFSYYGMVCHSDGTPLGTRSDDYIQFDPGIFIDDDGSIYLYSGNAPMVLDNKPRRQQSQVMLLENDMKTLKSEPKKLLPDIRDQDPDFAGHEFFEASSIRKINGKYYFVYSSVRSHELCYAVSSYPDRAFQFAGTIVDIGDIFLDQRTDKEALNHLGNTHGGIEKVGDHWYIFYHRQTNRTNFSRQGCAEEIFFDENGRIAQVPITSCGLNGGPLAAKGIYPASIACYLLGKDGAAFSNPQTMQMNYPFFTQDGPDLEATEELIQKDLQVPVQYIRNLQDGSVAGYRSFVFDQSCITGFEVRGHAEGAIEIWLSDADEKECQKEELNSNDKSIATSENMLHPSLKKSAKKVQSVPISLEDKDWGIHPVNIELPDGEYILYFRFCGSGSLDLRRFSFK